MHKGKFSIEFAYSAQSKSRFFTSDLSGVSFEVTQMAGVVQFTHKAKNL